MTARRKPGRPSRTGSPTVRLSQRYTVAEVEALCAAAERAGCAVGPWVRAAALSAALGRVRS